MSTFNGAVLAGLYSSLCGTLAGFAVAGLIFVVTLLNREGKGPSAEGERRTDDPDIPLALLTSAFVGLILTSGAYALMAGEPPQSQRLASEQVIAGAGFGTGALMLLLAVKRLVCGAAPDLTRWMRHVIGSGAPCVVWLYLAEGTRYVGSVTEPNPSALWLVLGTTGLVQFTSATVALRTRHRVPLRTRQFVHLASIGVLIPTIATALVALTPSAFANDAAPPVWVLYALLIVCTIGTTLFTLWVGRAEPGELPVTFGDEA